MIFSGAALSRGRTELIFVSSLIHFLVCIRFLAFCYTNGKLSCTLKK